MYKSLLLLSGVVSCAQAFVLPQTSSSPSHIPSSASALRVSLEQNQEQTTSQQPIRRHRRSKKEPLIAVIGRRKFE